MTSLKLGLMAGLLLAVVLLASAGQRERDQNSMGVVPEPAVSAKVYVQDANVDPGPNAPESKVPVQNPGADSRTTAQIQCGPSRAPCKIAPLPQRVGYFDFSKDGRLLAYNSSNMIYVLGVESLRLKQAFQFKAGYVDGLAFGPNGSRLVSFFIYQEEQAVQVWDPATGRLISELVVSNPSKKQDLRIIFKEEDSILLLFKEAVPGEGIKLRASSWNFEKPQESLRSLLVPPTLPFHDLTAVEASQDRQWLAITLDTTSSRPLRHTLLWNPKTGQSMTFEGRGLAFSPDNKLAAILVSTASNVQIKVINLDKEGGEELYVVDVASFIVPGITEKPGFTHFLFSPNNPGNLLVLIDDWSSAKPVLAIWNLKDGSMSSLMRIGEKFDQIKEFELMPDGQTIFLIRESPSEGQSLEFLRLKDLIARGR